jgi:hypothetical protein
MTQMMNGGYMEIRDAANRPSCPFHKGAAKAARGRSGAVKPSVIGRRERRER